MSTLIEDTRALLLTLGAAGGVWYATNTSQTRVYPYITFFRVASPANATLQGPSNTQNTRVQIDIYSSLLSDAVAIETALEAAFTGWATQNVPLLSQDFPPDETRAFRISKDYSIWSTS